MSRFDAYTVNRCPWVGGCLEVRVLPFLISLRSHIVESFECVVKLGKGTASELAFLHRYVCWGVADGGQTRRGR